MPKKRRTRQHIIADLSANYFERLALECGYSVERIEHDYGLDLILYTYDEHGNIENGQVFIQLKASDKLRRSADGQSIHFQVDRRDLDLWLGELMPCILVVFDVGRDMAYWLYLQAYAEGNAGRQPRLAARTATLRIPSANTLDRSAIREFAAIKNRIASQIRKVVRHET